MKKHLEIIVLICAILGGSFAAFQVFATNSRVDIVEEDLREYKMVQRLHALEERVWAYDKTYGFGCERCPPEAAETYRRLKQEIRDIERKLKKNT